MRIHPESRVHRGETPFRHGFRLIGLGLPDDGEKGELTLAIDVLDPIGRHIPVPGKTGTIIFDDPTVAIMLLRVIPEDEDSPARRRPVFMPAGLIETLANNAHLIGQQVLFSLLEGGADQKAAGRVGLSVISALQGETFRPDHFGVSGWSPHLSMPFGLVRSGPWISEPFEAEPIPKPEAPSAEEAA